MENLKIAKNMLEMTNPTGNEFYFDNRSINNNINAANVTINQYNKSSEQEQDIVTEHRLAWKSLNPESFCLFVLIDEKYLSKNFSIAKSCALRYTPEDYKKRYNVIFPGAVEEIKRMPCLFAQRNDDFKNAASNQLIKIGQITDIIRQGMNLKFSIEKYGCFKQQIVNENISRFGLLYNDLRNQLDEEHWSIRKGNLPQIIQELGIGIEWL